MGRQINLVGYNNRDDILQPKQMSDAYKNQEKHAAQLTIIANMLNVEDGKMLLEALDLFEKVDLSVKPEPNFTRSYLAQID